MEWEFNGGKHRYKWDRYQGNCEVYWDGYKVLLNFKDTRKSEVFSVDGNASTTSKYGGSNKSELIKKVLDFFNNDSFWLIAPYKVFDKGTTRLLVPQEDGTQGLLVTYGSGGTTPGDSYLWLLNDSAFPQSYRMWVKILPVGGVEASWDEWLISESGAFLPKSHKMGPVEIDMGNVRGYN